MRAFCLAYLFVLLSTSLTAMALPALISYPKTISVEGSGSAELPAILPRGCPNPLAPNCGCGTAGC
ncbi:hypothetical protein PM082_022591 [Marasmius tenuissimus]|nr:hypothetical protein PM082_022591 [Marasmius tenuissimus]